MSKNKAFNFSRSNVNEKTLNISDPLRSSFDLSHRSHVSLPFGKYLPVNIEKLMPNSTINFGMSPEMYMEKIQTPMIGRTRLDTHTFAVSARRINRDWNLFFEGAKGMETLPKVNFVTLVNHVLNFLFSYDPTTSTQTITNNWANELVSYSSTAASTHDVACHFYAKVISTYRYMATAGKPTTGAPHDTAFDTHGDYGYLRDFFGVEYKRLQTIYQPLYNISNGKTQDQVISAAPQGEPYYVLADMLYNILYPYFGEGSVCDMLGYPIFNKMGRAHQGLRTICTRKALGNGVVDDYVACIFTNYKCPILGVEGVATGLTSDYTPLDYSSTPQAITSILRSEMELRANFAAWYDCLRNWHLEKRENLINPDTWGVVGLFDIVFANSDLRSFYEACQLLLPRYCMYSRDFFTTIQTDDIFRRVFSPVMPQGSIHSGPATVQSDSLDSVNTFDFIQNIFNEAEPGGVFTPFLGGFMSYPSSSSSIASNVFRNDLQTMRRSGMLEKWLARNYYYPDTYAGQMMAHYGIEPSDFLAYCSDYIDGSETFLDGKQEINNTATSEMPAGTRTLVASASTKSGVMFSSNGDFVFLVSYMSLQPLVTYNAANMHLSEIHRMDMPFPEFANDARISISPDYLFRDCEDDNVNIGFVPRYYQYRVRADEAHGMFLNDYRSFCWLRDAYSNSQHYSGTASSDEIKRFRLDAYSMHVHMPLDAFLGLQPSDSVAYGIIEFVHDVNCPLPGAVEFI